MRAAGQRRGRRQAGVWAPLAVGLALAGCGQSSSDGGRAMPASGSGSTVQPWNGAPPLTGDTVLAAQTIGAGDNTLSFEPWTSVSNGWGPVERDRSNGEAGAGDGRTLTLNGKTYARGFGVHAESSMTFAVLGKCSRFTSDIGIDDEVGARGSVVFQVFADGVKVYDSGLLTGADATRSVNADIAGRRELRLVVSGAGSAAYDHADWAGAKLVNCDPSATPPAAPLAWSARAPMPTTLYEGQGAAVNGRLYVFGGYDRNVDQKPIATRAAFVYDPATDRWAALRAIPDAVTHAGVAVDGPNIYLAGGFLGDHPGPHTDHVWRYNTASDSWTALPPLPAARGAGALVRLGRNLHFFGGTERPDRTYVRDNGEHWVLNLDNPTGWSVAAPLPNPRNHLGGAVLGGRIYAIGGQHLGNEASGNLADVHVYDPATTSWRAVRPLPLPLGHITSSTVVWQGQIVVVGGVTMGSGNGGIEGRETDTVLAYDPATDRWTALTALPGPRQSPVADVIDGAIVTTTGSTATGPTSSTWLGR